MGSKRTLFRSRRAHSVSLLSSRRAACFSPRAPGNLSCRDAIPMAAGCASNPRKTSSSPTTRLPKVGAAELADRWMEKNLRRRKAARDSRPRTRAAAAPPASSTSRRCHLDIGAQVDSSRIPAPARRAQNRYTVVVVTHELNLAGEYADQVVLLQRENVFALVRRQRCSSAKFSNRFFKRRFRGDNSLRPPRVTLFSNK